jgi:hypothetical protein
LDVALQASNSAMEALKVAQMARSELNANEEQVIQKDGLSIFVLLESLALSYHILMLTCRLKQRCSPS